MEMHIDTRSFDEQDNTPVLITRGMLKQILRFMLGRAIEVPFIEEGKVIEGLICRNSGKLEITYSDGTISEVDVWDEVIE